MLHPMKAPLCDATVFMADDRYGGMELHCEGPPDHKPPHSHAMTACEPRAELVWWD